MVAKNKVEQLLQDLGKIQRQLSDWIEEVSDHHDRVFHGERGRIMDKQTVDGLNMLCTRIAVLGSANTLLNKAEEVLARYE